MTNAPDEGGRARPGGCHWVGEVLVLEARVGDIHEGTRWRSIFDFVELS
jgi:hypothetical protein